MLWHFIPFDADTDESKSAELRETGRQKAIAAIIRVLLKSFPQVLINVLGP
jgi:hypothetical protein